MYGIPEKNTKNTSEMSFVIIKTRFTRSVYAFIQNKKNKQIRDILCEIRFCVQKCAETCFNYLSKNRIRTKLPYSLLSISVSHDTFPEQAGVQSHKAVIFPP